MPELVDQRGISEQHPVGGASAGRIAALESSLSADPTLARVELRRQIARLERQLAEIFASAFPRQGFDWKVAPAGGPRLLGIGELEEVRDSLAARVAEARATLDRHGAMEEENRVLLERLIAEPEKHPWVRISNRDIGEPGCRHWHSRPRFGLLGMLLGWWRVRLSSGCPLEKGRRPPASRTKAPTATPPTADGGLSAQAPAQGPAPAGRRQAGS